MDNQKNNQNLSVQTQEKQQTQDPSQNISSNDVDKGKDNWPLLGFIWAILALILLGVALSNNFLFPVYRRSALLPVLYVLSTILGIIGVIFNRRGLHAVNATKGQRVLSAFGLVFSTIPIIVAFLYICLMLLVLAVV